MVCTQLSVPVSTILARSSRSRPGASPRPPRPARRLGAAAVLGPAHEQGVAADLVELVFKRQPHGVELDHAAAVVLPAERHLALARCQRRRAVLAVHLPLDGAQPVLLPFKAYAAEDHIVVCPGPAHEARDHREGLLLAALDVRLPTALQVLQVLQVWRCALWSVRG